MSDNQKKSSSLMIDFYRIVRYAKYSRSQIAQECDYP